MALIWCLCVLCFPAFVQTAASAPSSDRPPRAKGELLVKMREGVSPARLRERSPAMRNASSARISKKGLWRMATPPGLTEEEAAESLRAEASDLVEYAEPNYIIRAQVIPDDPRFGELYALTGAEGTAGIDAPAAWDILTGEEFAVAVVDSGVDYTHEDLAANIWANKGEIPANGIDDDGNGYIDDVRGWDFFSNDNTPQDEYFHGTHVAGIIGAVGDNGIGVVGVNWDVKMIPLRFMGPDGTGYLSGAVQAIEYATAMGAKVISCSWGLTEDPKSLEDAIRAADEAGVIVVAAAGNYARDNDLTPIYPASSPCRNVISVASINRGGDLSSSSCWGAQSVDIAAPGVAILSTVPGGYSMMSGTSMAAPHVSGAAMLAWAHDPSASHTEIISDILNGAEKSPSLSGKVATSGRLNLVRMLDPDGAVPPSPVTDPYVHAVSLTMNRDEFLPGEQLTLSATLGCAAQSPQPVCDGYVAVVLADGQLLFLAPGGRWSSEAVPLARGLRVTDLEAQIGTFTVTDTLPAGAYSWYAVLTGSDASPLRDSSRASNLAHAPFDIAAPQP